MKLTKNLLEIKLNGSLMILQSMPSNFIQKRYNCKVSFVKTILFVCGISLTSGKRITELFPYCLKVMILALVLRCRGSDQNYEMRFRYNVLLDRR